MTKGVRLFKSAKQATYCFAMLRRWAMDPDDKGIYLEDMSRRLALDGKPA
jgi:hypothetical protein